MCGRRAEKFSVLELTPEGLAVLKERKPVKLTRPVSAPEPQGAAGRGDRLRRGAVRAPGAAAQAACR